MKPLAERFWAKVKKGDGCWEWCGARLPSGYGHVHGGGRRASNLRAHRASWNIHFGAIPGGLHVLHKCDNRACVNPAHLFLGTDRDNVHDMRAKGREAPAPRIRGEANPSARLTAADVVEIRRTYASRDASMRAIAKRYGMSLQAIANAIHRHSWSHVQ